ncbi:Ferric/cupric reductase transmembrane component 2 [Podospora conica]|nr:Ferric/cupric reductase transmembrane component 2 [Schizothecium conicum]
MAWPYHFMDLNPAEKQLRREALDRYALYAQLSAVVPVVLGMLYRVAKSTLKSRSKNTYSSVPNPSLKNRESGGWPSTVRKVRWWLADEMAPGKPMGTRDQWVVGLSWAAWMLMLSVAGTGQDYLHFTKRLGIVAASQYPIQYLLALKYLNPVAYALGSSHEQVNKYHRVLGRVIALLITLHAILYFNFFIQTNILAKRMTAPIVRAGFVSFLLTHILNGTAQRPLRALSYRAFFLIHLFVAFVTPALLCIHAPPARPFFIQALAVFAADLATRKLTTTTTTATITPVPSTTLLQIVASLPSTTLSRFRAHPGAHIYLSLPSASSPSVLFAFLFNPFTVAAVDPAANTVTLVARRRAGPMTAALAAAGPAGKLSLAIEGPYGVAARFPRLVGGAYDRVLLVAGGIGATFTVPLYRALVEEGVKAEMVWVVRGREEVAWAATEGGMIMEEDENVRVFVTGTAGGGAGEGASGVEMGTLQQGGRRRSHGAAAGREVVKGRPDLKGIVDGVFRGGADERVAVLVCGPEAMAREVRGHVGVWARRGRDVWWHNEGFGF